jgi:MFS family permease
MSEQLAAWRRKRGRRVFDSFSAINSFSFAFVTGNTITLYALALGASSTVVGLLGALMYISFFSIPVGKLLLRRAGLVKIFANSWMLRNFSLLPLIAIPWLVSVGQSGLALGVLVLGVFFFNFFRGVGLISNNPVIGMLAPGRDRGEYIVRLSLINNITALLATVILAFLLWRDSGIGTYNLVAVVGILAGIVASSLVYRLPEPGLDERAAKTDRPRGAAEPGAAGRGQSFLEKIAGKLREENFRRFMASYLVIGLGIGMARPFIAVWCKSVYGMSDSLVTVFTIASSLGAILMGLVLRLTIDRLGAKPMYIIFAAISLLSLVPVLVSPGVGIAAFSVAFLCVAAALTNMGFAGQESAAQTYFFALVPKEEIVDLSMLYYFVLGATGAIGSFAGGAFLDGLAAFGASPLVSYRVFFAVSVLFIAAGIHIQRRLPDLGSYPVRDSIAVLLSPRDMRALTLLKRLDANEDPDEEAGIIAELGTVASSVSSEGLTARLSSPRYAVRRKAFQSVLSLERLRVPMRDALLAELSAGEFSNADQAARLLGKFGVQQAVPALRKAVSSADYRLAGEAMRALGRLGDTKSLTDIGAAMSSSCNPFILSRGIEAMEEFDSAATIPILADVLRRRDLPPHIADETILAFGSLMGVPKKFFYAYGEYVADRSRARAIVLDAVEESLSAAGTVDGGLKAILGDFIGGSGTDECFSRWMLDFAHGRAGMFSGLLVGAALDADLLRLEPFRFFLCFWAASIVRHPTLIEK